MNFLIIVAAVQDPNMRRAQHCGGPVVTRAFVHGRFAVALLILRAQVVRTKICCVPNDVVSIFVINDSCVVRGVVTIAPARCLDKGTMLQRLPTWPDVDLAGGGNRIALWQIVAPARQAVVSSLERQPVLAAPHPIANAVLLSSGRVGSYDR